MNFRIAISGAACSFESFGVETAEQAAQAVSDREPSLAADEALHVYGRQGREIIHIKPNAAERWIRRGIKDARAFAGLGLVVTSWR